MFEMHVTMWPDMPHYEYFAAKHPLVKGVRLNTAMASTVEMPSVLKRAVNTRNSAPIYLDIKGRQLRITHVDPNEDHLEIDINHPIEVETPCPVLFKAGADGALLVGVKGGTRLIFDRGPNFTLREGESLSIRAPHKVLGELFTDQQRDFLGMALEAGIDRYMLSYATSQAEIDELREWVGEAEIIAKIENSEGLEFAKNQFKPADNLHILTARGDLFVELPKPHDVLLATKELLKVDPLAILGSRILLSVTNESVPSCSDLNELAWLLDIGYRRFMFCDGLCLNKEALNRALHILAAVAADYAGVGGSA